MMGFFDLKIKRHTKEICPVSNQYVSRIDEIINGICEETTGKTIMAKYKEVIIKKRIRTALVVCVAILFISFPTMAAINYVAERMGQMSEDDRNSFYETAQNTQSEAVIYSREMSQDEKDRYIELFNQYEAAGLFPKSELKVVEIYDGTGEQQLVYEMDSRMMFLPSRDLTDEELLQIIDYYHKVDYSLSQSDETQRYKEDMEKKVISEPELEELTEDTARSLAINYLTQLYGTNTEECDVSVEYITAPDSTQKNYYTITAMDDIGTEYIVELVAEDGSLAQVVMTLPDADYYGESVAFQNDAVSNIYEDARNLFIEIFGDKRVVYSAAQYKVNEIGDLSHGNIQILFGFDDGNAYMFIYNLKYNVFWYVTYMPEYEMYEKAQSGEDNLKMLESQGLTRKVIEYDFD